MEQLRQGHPDALPILFDRFYRVESSHTRNIAGFGIGLYLSSEIIHQHSGTIWVESQKGVGSTFYFSLPESTADLPQSESNGESSG